MSLKKSKVNIKSEAMSKFYISYQEACGLLVMTYWDTNHFFQTCKDMIDNLENSLTKLEFSSSKYLESQLQIKKNYAIWEITRNNNGIAIDSDDPRISKVSKILVQRIKPEGLSLSDTDNNIVVEQCNKFLIKKGYDIIVGLNTHFFENPREQEGPIKMCYELLKFLESSQDKTNKDSVKMCEVLLEALKLQVEGK